MKSKIVQEIEAVNIPENIDDLPTLEQLAVYWLIIVAVLKFVKIFTGAKTDEKIDMVIKWGEDNL